MAKKEKAEQMDLIEVLPENVKAIRAAIRKRDEYHDEHLTANKKAKEYEGKIWALVTEAGGKLDKDGKLRLKISEDEVLEIKQSPAKLTVSVKSPKKNETEEEGAEEEADSKEGGADGKEPGAVRRGRSSGGD